MAFREVLGDGVVASGELTGEGVAVSVVSPELGLPGGGVPVSRGGIGARLGCGAGEGLEVKAWEGLG